MAGRSILPARSIRRETCYWLPRRDQFSCDAASAFRGQGEAAETAFGQGAASAVGGAAGEPGESGPDCLARELLEELSVKAQVCDYLGENIHDYGSKRVHLLAYAVSLEQGEIVLQDHDAAGWFTVEELRNLELAPADIPLLDYISPPQSGQP